MTGRRGFLGALAAIAAAPIVGFRRRAWWRVPNTTTARYYQGLDGEQIARWFKVPPRLIGMCLALAFLWSTVASAKDATNVSSREVLCFNSAGGAVPCPTVEVSILGGALVLMGSEGDAALSPLARVLVTLPLAQGSRKGWLPIPPSLHVQADLSALQGETLSLEDVSTWRALEFRVGASQRIHDFLNADLYAEAGFATRLPGELEARDRAVRWVGAGVRIGRLGPGWLSLALGADQRLDGQYQPAVLLAGAIQIGERAGVALFLTGDAILGLDYAGSAPRRDVVRIGLAVGR